MFKKIQKDRRGLTLVELICAIAILSIITGTVGGAMVVATDSYRRSTVETSLQQEAQFTANSIESLIIDVTKSVEWNGTDTLVIKNDDSNYYEIKHVGEQLKFKEVVAGVASTEELLADHVSGFTVDASNFESSRNVLLTITMQNGSSTYTTDYNITSRNNPNGDGSSTTAVARIICEDEIVVEPNQEYFLSVSISGLATTYSGNFSETTNSIADNSPADGILLKIAEDQVTDLTLHIETAAKDSEGNAFYKNVKVYVRRVNDITEVSKVSLSGADGKKDAIYTVSVPQANIVGSHLDQLPLLSDSDWVDPYKVHWELCAGASTYVELLDNSWDALHMDTIRFKLKDDIPEGTTLYVVKAVALHPNGKENDATGTAYNTNKTGMGYGSEVSALFSITVAGGTADFARGKFTYIETYPSSMAGMTLKKWIAKSTGKDESTAETRMNLDSVKVFIRTKSQVNASHCSEGYDEGYWYLGNGGGGLHEHHGNFLTVDPDDFVGSGRETWYMEGYDVDLFYAIRYGYQEDSGSYTYKWYPDEINSWPGVTSSSLPMEVRNGVNVLKVPSAPSTTISKGLTPMQVEFNYDYATYDGYRWWPEPAMALHYKVNVASYRTDDKLGLMIKPKGATADNPIKIVKGDKSYEFKTDIIGAASKNGGAVSLFSNAKIECVDNPSLTPLNASEKIYYDGTDTSENDGINNYHNYGKFWIKDFNGFQTGMTYRLVLDKFVGYKGTEWESYQNSYASAGKGIIYFQIVDSWDDANNAESY